MTPEQAKRIAELHASGASERQISADTGVPATSVHREIVEIKRRAAEQDVPEHQADEPKPSPAGEGCKSEPGQHDAEVLQAADEVLNGETRVLLVAAEASEAEQLTTVQERAEASRRALVDLEDERLVRIDAGQDAAPLRSRIANAHLDLADNITAAERCAERLSVIRARIAELDRLEELATKRAERDSAASEATALALALGDVQRECVTASRAVAERFTAAVTGEAAGPRPAGRAADGSQPA